MEQVLIGGYYNLLHTTTTEYNIVVEGYSWSATKAERAQAISTPGKLKNLRVELNDVPGTGTYTFTLHRAVGLGAWANTALTCTVAADGTQASDMVNEVAVAAGDVISLECNPDAPDNARYAKWTMVFVGDNANESLLLMTAHTGVGFLYLRLMGYGVAASEPDARCICPTGGKIKNLYVWLSEDPGTDPDAYKFTLRVGGVAQLLTCTIVANNRRCNNVANEITVAAGNALTLEIEPIGGPSVYPKVALGMTFVADTDGESLILGGSNNSPAKTDPEYNRLIPYDADTWIVTEAERYQLAQECTLKKLYMVLATAPGAGTKYTFTVRKNAASPGGGLVVEFADAATTGNDVANEIAVVNDDELDLMCVPDSSPEFTKAFWGLVSYRAPPAPPVGLVNKSANMGSKMVGAGLI